MPTNLNIDPYYEDFNPKNDYYQVMFKPGMAVQARELTQIQSISRDQIAKFGNHVFKQGSVVIPGNSTSDLNICFVKILPNFYTSYAALEGKEIVGLTSGLRGLIRKGIGATATDPTTLYVSYYNTGINGEKIFGNSETLTVPNISTPFITVSEDACGGSSMAYINEGVFFVNGTFVNVAKQSIVIGKYTSEPSCRVLLRIEETLVNSDQDQTLLDPAQGSYNYAAPGADRLKITLTLTTQELSMPITADYIEIMRYNQGVLEEHLRYAKYNELEKNLARRTYDESGDYVASGLGLSVREHLKSTINGGRYAPPLGDSRKMIYSIDRGKAYIRGFEQEVEAVTELTVDKARTPDHLLASPVNLTPSYGQFLYVTNIVGLPNFLQREQVTIYNSTAGGAIIGTARVVAIDYVEPNTTDANGIYQIFISDVSLNSGVNNSDIARLTYSGGNMNVLSKYSVISDNATDFALNEVVTFSNRVATAHKYIRATGNLYVFKHSVSKIPVTGDKITAVSGASCRINSSILLGKNIGDNLLFELPHDSVYRIKNGSNVTDLIYKIYYETTVTCSGGAGSFSVTGMTIDPKEQGNFIISSATGIKPLSTATISGDGMTVSFSGITPVDSVLRIVASATKTGANASPKTKTLVTSFTEIGRPPSDRVQLIKADGVLLRSVVSTVDGDVTKRYRLDNGQRDYVYSRSSIELVTGVVPTGTLTVVYDFLNHNSGSGDYFAVDSYESSGLPEYFSSPALIYRSKNTSKAYDLRNVLDFRPREGDDGTLSSGTASVNRMVQIDSRITTSVRRYVGRIDLITYDRDGILRVIKGTPASEPIAPSVSNETMLLGKVVVPAYTYFASDSLIIPEKNRGYTMQDVGKLEDRIQTLEDYVTLTTTENNLVNFDVVDAATGLSRFKSGYLVDSFDNPDIISDINNPFFKVVYDSGLVTPMFEIFEATLTVKENNLMTTNRVLTLPYVSVVFAQQPFSSRITNINPFAVLSWVAPMTITPSTDTWSETLNLAPVINTTTIVNTTVTFVDVVRAAAWTPENSIPIVLPSPPVQVSLTPGRFNELLRNRSITQVNAPNERTRAVSSVRFD